MLCFQTALMDTAALAEEVASQGPGVGLRCLFLQASLLLLLLGFVGLLYGCRLRKLVTETAHQFHGAPPFAGK